MPINFIRVIRRTMVYGTTQENQHQAPNKSNSPNEHTLQTIVRLLGCYWCPLLRSLRLPAPKPHPAHGGSRLDLLQARAWLNVPCPMLKVWTITRIDVRRTGVKIFATGPQEQKFAIFVFICSLMMSNVFFSPLHL